MADERKNIDEITRTLTTLDGTERFPGRDGSGDFKATIQAIADLLPQEPVGTIKAWDKTFPSTPSLSDYYVECDGASISDSDSVYNGYRSRLLNNDSISFSVTWASGVATIAATDVTALLVGQSVSGGAIAAGAYITDITGTTVTMSDTSYSGTLSTTFSETNGGRYLRGAAASGVGSLDKMQGHWHAQSVGTDLFTWVATGGGFSISTSGGSTADNTGVVTDPITDSVNGAPRTGAETSVLDMTVVWIMKIK